MSRKPTTSTIYIETSLISYFWNQDSNQLDVIARQHITRAWWGEALPHLNPWISEYVLLELMQGDPKEVRKRREICQNFGVLDSKPEIEPLAREYIKKLSLPKNGQIDAYHLASASIHEIDFLVTWNCRHIANAFKYPLMRKINNAFGYSLPIICTPLELMEI